MELAVVPLFRFKSTYILLLEIVHVIMTALVDTTREDYDNH